MSACATAENQQHRWVKRGNLVDSRTSVTDVKFGPKHLGLILVSCVFLIVSNYMNVWFGLWIHIRSLQSSNHSAVLAVVLTSTGRSSC